MSRFFLGDWEQLPGSHNRIPGGNLTPSALQTPTKTLRGSAEKETPPAACQPITASLPFDFPTPPLRLASAARRDTRPRVVIGGFSRLCGSHLNTPPFGSERSAAGSNIRGAETEWRPEQHRSTSERLDWLPPDFTDRRQKVADRPGSPAAAPAATEAVSSSETAALGYF